MFKAVYDTRFFMESYYTTNLSTAKKLRENFRQTRERFISAVVIHEVYQLTLRREGRETAILRATVLEQDYTVVEVDAKIARLSAELRIKYTMSMADSIIAATALSLKATCVSDDPHFKAVKEIKTDWI
ncbi:MAG: PIN domain-containing protein [Candidatus Bathyarchaeia archaeon]